MIYINQEFTANQECILIIILPVVHLWVVFQPQMFPSCLFDLYGKLYDLDFNIKFRKLIPKI